MQEEKQEINKTVVENLIRGALWGGVMGDVIGAYLQFDKDITAKKLKEAFEIIGGGKHNLEAGQPTDDSELNFSVLKGLTRAKGCLNLNYIAEEMGNWYLSKPIDVGNTIRNSVPKACNMKVHQAHLVRKGAKECSQTSQSNGTLMALIGLAIWCHKLSPEQIYQAIRQFTILIHPNQLVVESNVFYTLMVGYLLNNPNQQNRAIKAFYFAKDEFLKRQNHNKEFKIWVESIEKSFNEIGVLHENAPINKASGWVRVALSYAIYYLVKGKSYKSSIQEIIKAKGDTDTNACIMGGILGAYYGFQELKASMAVQIEKIESWRPKNVKRPNWLVPALVIQKGVIFLLSSSPETLKIIGSQKEYQK